MAETQTLGFTESPTTARFRFKMRGINNLLLALYIFSMAAFLGWLTGFPERLLICFTAYCHVLSVFLCSRKARNRFAAGTALKAPVHTSWNTPWVCGFKECSNHNTISFPFLNCCENCHAEPKAYECHHCGKVIFSFSPISSFPTRRDASIFRRPTFPPRSARRWGKRRKKKRQEEKQKREKKRHDIARAELDEKARQKSKNATKLRKSKVPARNRPRSSIKFSTPVWGLVNMRGRN